MFFGGSHALVVDRHRPYVYSSRQNENEMSNIKRGKKINWIYILDMEWLAFYMKEKKTHIEWAKVNIAESNLIWVGWREVKHLIFEFCVVVCLLIRSPKWRLCVREGSYTMRPSARSFETLDWTRAQQWDLMINQHFRCFVICLETLTLSRYAKTTQGVFGQLFIACWVCSRYECMKCTKKLIIAFELRAALGWRKQCEQVVRE